mmetsp:Transcript_125876/g.298821  ORF Transcript_125876/g.298821 Transcript_125876/m.298821 type:complete len:371 (-) Transcript_125876:502-1614(-)
MNTNAQAKLKILAEPAGVSQLFPQQGHRLPLSEACLASSCRMVWDAVGSIPVHQQPLIKNLTDRAVILLHDGGHYCMKPSDDLQHPVLAQPHGGEVPNAREHDGDAALVHMRPCRSAIVTVNDACHHFLRDEVGEGPDATQKLSEGSLEGGDIFDARPPAVEHAKLRQSPLKAAQAVHVHAQVLQGIRYSPGEQRPDAHANEANGEKDQRCRNAGLIDAQLGAVPHEHQLADRQTLRSVGLGVERALWQHCNHQPPGALTQLQRLRADLQAIRIAAGIYGYHVVAEAPATMSIPALQGLTLAEGQLLRLQELGGIPGPELGQDRLRGSSHQGLLRRFELCRPAARRAPFGGAQQQAVLLWKMGHVLHHKD